MTEETQPKRVDRGFLLLTAGPTGLLIAVGLRFYPEVSACSYAWIWLLLHLGLTCLVLSLQSLIESFVMIAMACLVLAGLLWAGWDKLSDELLLLFTTLLASIAGLPIALGLAALFGKSRQNPG